MSSRNVRVLGLAVLSVLLVTGAGWSVWAEGDAGPTKKAKPAKVRGAYAKLDLTAEQREKIAGIQKDIAEQIAALKRQEREMIAAVLTEEQRATLHRKADHDKLQKRVWGMKGYLKRLENQRSKLAAKQEKADGKEAEKLAAKLSELDEKIEKYEAKLAAEESELRALSDQKGD